MGANPKFQFQSLPTETAKRIPPETNEFFLETSNRERLYRFAWLD
jgi:hypothetical protein